MTDGPVRLDREGPLAILTVSKPPVNLYAEDVHQGLEDAIAEVERDAPRGLLLRAEGKVWTGGVDVNVFAPLEPDTAAELWQRGFDLIHRIEELPFPTVFAAHALCLTWGFEIAMACDLLLAAEGATFGLVETVVGLTPAMGGTQRLAERAGPARARELVMTGALYDAATLERWNVVNEVWPDDEFEGKAKRFAERLAAGPTKAHAATKAIVRAQKEGGARRADAIVPEVAGDLFGTQDLKQAVQTFLREGPGNATFEGR
jgi:enoyl-CoA hydratase/carnithine racemase